MAIATTSRRACWLRLALLAGTALVSAAAVADELPRGASVAHGKVGVATSGDRMTIRQGSRRAIVNWRGFSIGEGARVEVRQPSRKAAILNRVTGSTPSSIAGRLDANGKVYLVNPNGVVIGPRGVVRAGGFVASTLDIDDADFRAGRGRFAGNGASAPVANHGAIEIGPGGYATLLGGAVENAGTISVPLGKVGLGAGERVTLDPSGDGFLQVTGPSLAGPDGALVESSGTISADGGRVEIKAAAARQAARHAINLSGVVEARRVGGVNGAIVLGGGDGGRVTVSGRLDASAPRKPEPLRMAGPPRKRPATGGVIVVTGAEVALSGARLDASGRDGGGAIRVGGDYQGRGDVPRSRLTEIDAATTLAADALRSGDGGSVIVWSDADASYAGRISARGGPLGGDGGFAEVSGKARLAFSGAADLSAPRGARGMLLLDPFDVTISVAPGSGGFTAGGEDWIVNAGALLTALSAADVTVLTDSTAGDQAGDITVEVPLSWSSDSTLTLSAMNDISIEDPITAGNGGLTLDAGGVITTNSLGAIDVGTFILEAGDWVQSGPALPDFAAQDFRVIEGSSFLRVAGGDGTSGDPLQIFDAYGLQGLEGFLDADVALINDIDASGTAGWNNNEATEGGIQEFDPIGGAEAPYSGTFDGGGFVVEGLSVNRPFETGVGLFTAVGDTGVVRNVTLTGAEVSGGPLTGGLAGANAGLIEDSSVSGLVSGLGSDLEESDVLGLVGGLVGLNAGSIVGASSEGAVVGTSFSIETSVSSTAGGLAGSNTGDISVSFSTADVIAAADWGGNAIAGGLVGDSSGEIVAAFATGDVTAVGDGAQAVAGGLVGSVAEGGSVASAFATGDVDASGAETFLVTGGLVGDNAGAISQAYATGDVDQQIDEVGFIGGLAGFNSGSIDEAYAAGLVFGGEDVGGGMVGVSDGGTATDSFWDTQSTGQATTADGGVGLTTAEFQDTALFTATAGAAGWDFQNVWSPPTPGFYPELFALSPVVSVSIDDAARDYGAANPAFSAVTFGGPGLYVFNRDGDTLDVGAALTTAATPASDVGDYAITGPAEAFSADGVEYRLIILDEGVLTVEPVPLQVIADPATRRYGAADPAFTASFEGFVLGQDVTDLGGSLAFASTAGATSGVGPYVVTPSGLASGNYVITFTPGAFTITPAPLTVAANPAARRYGQDNPAFTASFTGFVLGEGVADLDGALGFATDATAASDVGPYAVTPFGLESAKYTISFAPGTLEVTPAPLRVTADDLSKLLGETLVFRGDEFTAEGLVNGDTVRSVRLTSDGAAASAPLSGSPYAILADDAAGTGLGNYDIVYVPGALTVLPPEEGVVEPTPPASRLPTLTFARLETQTTIVVDDRTTGVAAAAGGGPTLGTGESPLAVAEDTLAFVLGVSRSLEAEVEACDPGALAFDGYLGCLRDALDAYGTGLDARILDLPEPLRAVSAVIQQATRRIEAARVTAAEGLRAARTPEETAAVQAAAAAEARAAVGEAVEEIRRAIELIRADEPEVARLQSEQGVAIAAALEAVDLGLTRAVGL